jgi:phage terminase large subunit-like protein
MPWLAIAQLAVTVLLSGVAYFANDTLMDVRGDIKGLDAKIDATNAKIDTKIDTTNAKIDASNASINAKFDALIQGQLLDRVMRLESDRFSPSEGTVNSK